MGGTNEALAPRHLKGSGASIYYCTTQNIPICLLNFEFIVCLLFIKNVLEQSHILSTYLQSLNVNYTTANDMYQSTIMNDHFLSKEIENI